MAGLVAVLNRKYPWETSLLVLPVVYVVYRSYRVYLSELEDRDADTSRRWPSSHLRTIEALALAIEAKDQTTHEHLQRVQVYAIEIGQGDGLTPKREWKRCTRPRCCTTSASWRCPSTSSPSPED